MGNKSEGEWRERLSGVNTNQRKMKGSDIKVLKKHELGGWEIMTCHVDCAIPAASLSLPSCLSQHVLP